VGDVAEFAVIGDAVVHEEDFMCRRFESTCGTNAAKYESEENTTKDPVRALNAVAEAK
jgi:hypothetical protein